MKIYNLFAGFILIAFSIATYISGTFTPYFLHKIELGLLKYPLSFITFFYGIKIIIKYKTIQLEEDDKYTICPKCKELFNYNELKDGKC